MSTNFKIRRFARGLGYPEEVRHQVWIGSFTTADQKKLFTRDAAAGLSTDGIYDRTMQCFKAAERLDPLDRAMYIYAKTYMTDDILTKVDRASMANSLEVRAPFLDADLAAYAARIPSSLKLKGMTTKWILKEALKGRLPAPTIGKRKQGFAVPVAQWLKEDLREMLLDAFSESKIRREGIFDPAYVTRIVGDFAANKEDTRKEIWALFMFEIWYDTWKR